MTKEIKDLKNLNLAELKKQSKKLNETKPFKVTIGDTEYKLTHDVAFRKTKQQALLEDMLKFFNEIGDSNMELLELTSPYTALLIIKHFTSLEVPDAIDEAIELLKVLIDLEVLSTIVNELPEDEIVKVYELLTQTVENIKASVEDAESELEVIAGDIENNDVLKLVEAEVVEEVKEEVIEDGESN